MLVSIVIPVRHDATALAQLLAQLPPAPDVELIVSVAAPMDDATQALRQGRGDVRWLETAPGRGVQLNAGADLAGGEWLWFLHADSRVPRGWLHAFRSMSSADDGFVGGSFRFVLDSRAWQARFLEQMVALRVRALALPYGDQGIFVRRAVFQSIGGFAPLPLMEDVDFVRRLKRIGRLRHLSLQLTTSARRWERDGWVRRSAGNLLILTMYLAGVSPQRLARRYYLRQEPDHADKKAR
jgi:rSAM/selenodomain-associated transferase 2